MQSRIRSAFWAARAHCQLMPNFSSTCIPKSLAGLLSIHSSSSLLSSWGLSWPRCSALHLALLSLRVTWARSSSLPWYLWMWPPFPLADHLHHSPWCHLQTCWGYTQSHCLRVLVLIKTELILFSRIFLTAKFFLLSRYIFLKLVAYFTETVCSKADNTWCL